MTTEKAKITPEENRRNSHSYREGLAETRTIGRAGPFKNPTALLLGYWVLCAAVSIPFLWNELTTWRVGQAWQLHWFWAILALVVTIVAQIAYIMVARHDGRPLNVPVTLLFVVVNGILEALVFMTAYKIFFWLSQLVFGGLDVINFIFGFIGFVIYSGIIHGFFWARLLPPHFSDEPKLQPLRKQLTPIQAAIVLAWCLYFYFTGDIWTIVFLHFIIDAVLMVRVRPPLFATK
jgi:chlorophyllide a hydrolase